MYIHIQVYIYKRERRPFIARTSLKTYTYAYKDIYIYIYIYRERERERERGDHSSPGLASKHTYIHIQG